MQGQSRFAQKKPPISARTILDIQEKPSDLRTLKIEEKAIRLFQTRGDDLPVLFGSGLGIQTQISPTDAGIRALGLCDQLTAQALAEGKLKTPLREFWDRPAESCLRRKLQTARFQFGRRA
jgi:hypothetical protein